MRKMIIISYKFFYNLVFVTQLILQNYNGMIFFIILIPCPSYTKLFVSSKMQIFGMWQYLNCKKIQRYQLMQFKGVIFQCSAKYLFLFLNMLLSTIQLDHPLMLHFSMFLDVKQLFMLCSANLLNFPLKRRLNRKKQAYFTFHLRIK